MRSLKHFLTQSWSLRKRNSILNLENNDSEMEILRETLMDYMALERAAHGAVEGDACGVGE